MRRERVRIFKTLWMIGMILAAFPSCERMEEAESVAIQYLEASRDGDRATLARLSIVDEPAAIVKWRRVSAESHRDDQGTVEAFLRDLEAYLKGKERLQRIVQEHQHLLSRRGTSDEGTMPDTEKALLGERDRLLVEMEEIHSRHVGLFQLLDADVLSRILQGRPISEFRGPYRVEIYFYFAEISSVSPMAVKIQHRLKIELARLSLEGLKTGWLVYRINDLSA
jgi:hypothetical protein